MFSKINQEQLPTGKSVIKFYDAHGRLVQEIHKYDKSDCRLAIIICYDDDGVVVDYQYMLGVKIISRKKYEELRRNFSDMPAPEKANAGVKDTGPKSYKKWKLANSKHEPDYTSGRDNDERLAKIISYTDTVPIFSENSRAIKVFFEEKPVKPITSVQKRIREIGFVNAWFIDVDMGKLRELHEIDCNGLIVELPPAALDRERVFMKIARYLTPAEFDAPHDNGQSYEFIKEI